MIKLFQSSMIYTVSYTLRMCIFSSMSRITRIKIFIRSIKGIVCVTMGAALWVSRVIGTETLYPGGYSWWPCFIRVIFHLDFLHLIYNCFLSSCSHSSISFLFISTAIPWTTMFWFLSLTYYQDLQKKVLMRAIPLCTEFVWRMSRVYLPFTFARYELPMVVHGSLLYTVGTYGLITELTRTVYGPFLFD